MNLIGSHLNYKIITLIVASTKVVNTNSLFLIDRKCWFMLIGYKLSVDRAQAKKVTLLLIIVRFTYPTTYVNISEIVSVKSHCRIKVYFFY